MVREETRKSSALIFFLWRKSPTWAKATSLLRIRDQSARHRDLYLTTHNIHRNQTNASGGIQTRNPWKRAAADQCLRPGGNISNQCNHGNYRNTDNDFTQVPIVTFLLYVPIHKCK